MAGPEKCGSQFGSTKAEIIDSLLGGALCGVTDCNGFKLRENADKSDGLVAFERKSIGKENCGLPEEDDNLVKTGEIEGFYDEGGHQNITEVITLHKSGRIVRKAACFCNVQEFQLVHKKVYIEQDKGEWPKQVTKVERVKLREGNKNCIADSMPNYDKEVEEGLYNKVLSVLLAVGENLPEVATGFKEAHKVLIDRLREELDKVKE